MKIFAISLLAAVSLAAAPPIVIQNANVLTITKGSFKGSVVVQDGKIVEVGEKVIVPPGAQIIDAAGQYLMPGIIDCHSHIAADSINEGSVSVSSMVGIEDVLNPEDISIYRALAGGVTTANILHGSANSIGGKCAVIKTRWGKDTAGVLFEGAKPGIKFALGENVKRSGQAALGRGARGGGADTSNLRYPGTRMGVEDVIRQAFTDARQYQKDWQDYQARKSRGEQVIPPRRDLKLDPLVEVLEGKRLVHAHCYRSDEILMLLRVADDFGFKIKTLQHVLEGYKVAKEIAAHGAGASTFSDWWGYKVEAYDAIPYNAAIMMKKGVIVSLNSDSAELMRRLNTEAGKTMKYGGLTETEALSLITINPAKQLDIDNRVGSIEVGKDADLVIYDKHPLSSFAKVQRVLIDGTMYFERDKDISDREKEQLRKKQLIEKEKQAQPQQKKGRAGTEAGMKFALLLSLPLALMAGSDDTFLLRGVTINPVIGAKIENASLLVTDGRIADMGVKVTAPKGVKIIDAKGLHVYPGMIDSATEVGMEEIGSVRETNDTTELGDFKPQLRAAIAVNPGSEHIPVIRANGITAAIALPAGGIIAGQASLMHLDGWTWEEMAIKRDAAMHLIFPSVSTIGFNFAEGITRASYADSKRNYDRRLKLLSDYFESARRYQKAKAAGGAMLKPDLAFEAMLPVLAGKTPLLVNAVREKAIKDAVAWAEKERVRIILSGIRKPGNSLAELKAKNIAVILGPTLALPVEEDDPYDAAFTLPADLHKAGVKFAFGSFGNQFARNLPYQAATAAAFGLPPEEALKSVTINPARIWGVDETMGSIEKGKWADLIVTDGDPLEVKTNLKRMFIKGKEVDLESRHTKLYKRYLARP